MQIQAAPPAPFTAATPSAPVPARISTALIAPTSTARPAHPLQTTTPTQTFSPARYVPPAQPAQTATPIPKTIVPALSAAPTSLATDVADPGQDVTANTVLNQNAATPGDDEKEAALAAEIWELWRSEVTQSTVIRYSSKQISGFRLDRAALRLSLGERLDEYKHLLVRAGRPGRWMAYLREMDIPKSTAERYVEKCRLSKTPKPVNRPSGTIRAPSREEIEEIVKKVKVKVVRVLTTPESISQFLTELAATLQTNTP